MEGVKRRATFHRIQKVLRDDRQHPAQFVAEKSELTTLRLLSDLVDFTCFGRDFSRSLHGAGGGTPGTASSMPPKNVPKWKRDSKKTGVSPKELEWEQKEQESNLQV